MHYSISLDMCIGPYICTQYAHSHIRARPTCFKMLSDLFAPPSETLRYANDEKYLTAVRRFDIADEHWTRTFASSLQDLRSLFSRLLQLCEHRAWLQDAVRGGSDGPAGFLHYLLSGYSPGALPHKPAKDSIELRALVTGRFRGVLHRLCEAWGPPCLVTIARSTRDGYCPPDHVELLQELVLQEIRGELQSPIDLRLEEG